MASDLPWDRIKPLGPSPLVPSGLCIGWRQMQALPQTHLPFAVIPSAPQRWNSSTPGARHHYSTNCANHCRKRREAPSLHAPKAQR